MWAAKMQFTSSYIHDNQTNEIWSTDNCIYCLIHKILSNGGYAINQYRLYLNPKVGGLGLPGNAVEEQQQ